MTKVKLLSRTIHDGKFVAAGEVISVEDATAQYLIDTDHAVAVDKQLPKSPAAPTPVGA